jgi:ribosomal protein L11 methyltransferase
VLYADSVDNSLNYLLRAEVPEELVDELEAECESRGLPNISAWGLADSDKAEVSLYFDDPASAEAAIPVLSELLPPGTCCGLDTVKAEDWQNAWKRFFKPARVSVRVVVRPSWEPWLGGGECVEVVIDPGMSFGTGLHPTTRACIGFIDRLAGGGKSFLDAGCGSGILSIAAAKLGFSPVTAFDLDPVAVECASANAAINGVHGVSIACMSLSGLKADVRYDLVAVNILAPVILKNAEIIASVVRKPAGCAALAGIRAELFPAIRARFEAIGFRMLESVSEDEWTSGLFQWR